MTDIFLSNNNVLKMHYKQELQNAPTQADKNYGSFIIMMVGGWFFFTPTLYIGGAPYRLGNSGGGLEGLGSSRGRSGTG